AYSAEIFIIGSVTPRYNKINEVIKSIKDIVFLELNGITLTLNKLFIKILPHPLNNNISIIIKNNKSRIIYI
ncbi:MAG: hypothetical protein DBW65_01410, partial [Alphaproteobacteria bacterium]